MNVIGKCISLILDLDGVLITTPNWKADTIHADGYSDFNPICVENLNKLTAQGDFDIWLSSTLRQMKSLKEFNQIFENRGITNNITGFLSVDKNFKSRHDEVVHFITTTKPSNYIILDDDKSLNGLDLVYKEHLVLTELTIGFNNQKYSETISVLNKFK